MRITCNANEAPRGHYAVSYPRDEAQHSDPACLMCSMYVDGYCQVKSPHGCSALDRGDACDVIFKRKVK